MFQALVLEQQWWSQTQCRSFLCRRVQLEALFFSVQQALSNRDVLGAMRAGNAALRSVQLEWVPPWELEIS